MTFDSLSESRLEEAAAVLKQSWRENPAEGIDFDVEFLRAAYAYPGTDPRLSPALIEDGRLTAFVSAFPRTAVLDGREVRLALLTFFTVSAGNKGRGLGKAVWAECLQRVRAAGYEGAVHYCVAGNPSNGVIAAAARSVGLEAVHVRTLEYLVGPADASGSAGADAAPGVAPALLLQLAAAAGGCSRLARVWSPEEAEWQCSRRAGAFVLPLRGESGAEGLLTGYRVRLAGPAATPVLILDDILWGGLAAGDQDAAVKELRRQARTAVISVPLWGCADTAAFVRARFRRSPARTNVYLTMWNGQPVSGEFGSMYMDVF